MKIIEQLKDLADEIEGSWIDEVEKLQSANNGLVEQVAELEAEARSFADAANRLHDAICEGRRQDAIDILNDVTGENYRSVAEQRNLFPDRVPA